MTTFTPQLRAVQQAGEDFYFRVKHPTLAWNVLEVLVRPEGAVWQYSYGYQLATCGFGGPFEGMAPTRENAGRIGLVRLRNALWRLAGDGELDGRDGDQASPANSPTPSASGTTPRATGNRPRPTRSGRCMSATMRGRGLPSWRIWPTICGRIWPRRGSSGTGWRLRCGGFTG